MQVESRETEDARWEVARRTPHSALRPYVLGVPEGWEQAGRQTSLREVPFPGVPMILNLGESWQIEDPGLPPERRDSFVAGMHTAPTVVHPGAAAWSCIELRLTPLGARRILGVPMDELANRTVELGDLLPGIDELQARLHETPSWAGRFDLVETFLVRRLADSVPPSPGVEWSWQRLRRSGGRASIGALAAELGWSHRRLIARFREQIGLAPKAVARVMRFDRTVAALTSPSTRGLAEIAFECGYFDQAHLNREFRHLAGMTPTSFLASSLDSGGVAA